MWKYKKWDQNKKPIYDENQSTGVKCEYCSEKPIKTCENCRVEICETHAKELRTRYPPYYKVYCTKCRKRHYMIRGITIGSTIAVFLGFAIYQGFNPPSA